MAYMRLGDLLVSSGVITNEQLEKAREMQKETKERLGEVLIRAGFITEQPHCTRAFRAHERYPLGAAGRRNGRAYAYRRSFAPRAYGPLRIAEHRHLAPQDHGRHEHCRAYRRIFDIARLVAPTICVELTKMDEGCTLKKSEHCYAVWKKKRRCENCIS